MQSLCMSARTYNCSLSVEVPEYIPIQAAAEVPDCLHFVMSVDAGSIKYCTSPIGGPAP